MSVLVADPDPGACLLCARSLQLQEHQVIQATDGREALVKALSTNPSIFITETVLPFIDGYSLCEVLRNDAAMTSVPILVATADARVESLSRAMEAGADSVLVKPYEPDEMRSEVARLIGRSESLRASSQQLLANAVARRARAAAVLERSIQQRRMLKVRAHARYDTSSPPSPPPSLHCPSAMCCCSTNRATSGA